MPFLKRTEVNLYYELSGSGPPILFIQGVGVIGECWRPQVNSLAQKFQTLLFDNRGIGQSSQCTGPITIERMAQDASLLMDAAGWDSAHVVGHSMGGVIAQQLALDQPSRIRSLSLLSTFARGKDAARLTPWVLWMTLRTRLGTRTMRRNAFLEMLWPRDELEQENTSELAQKIKTLVGRDLADQPPILMKQVLALSKHNTLQRLGELRSIPTLVLTGEHDPIALPRYGQELAKAIPNAVFESVPASSHAMTIQKADWINRRLEQFIAPLSTSLKINGSQTLKVEANGTYIHPDS